MLGSFNLQTMYIIKIGQTTVVRAVDGGDDLGIGPVRHLNRYQRSPSEHINLKYNNQLRRGQ